MRRGQDFDVTVIFNRPYDASKDTVTLQFAVGKFNRYEIFLPHSETSIKLNTESKSSFRKSSGNVVSVYYLKVFAWSMWKTNQTDLNV